LFIGISLPERGDIAARTGGRRRQRLTLAARATVLKILQNIIPLYGTEKEAPYSELVAAI
jgi:hypothetical protein